MPALAPKRASKSLKAERDRDRAPPAYMVRGRKTPRDRDDSYSDDSSRSRSPSDDDSRSKTRGFAATKTKKRAPAFGFAGLLPVRQQQACLSYTSDAADEL